MVRQPTCRVRRETLLGIDPGGVFGWAVLAGAKHVASGEVDCLLPEAHPGARFEALRSALVDLFVEHAPAEVAFEHPIMRTLKSWAAVRSIAGTIVLVESVASMYGVPCFSVPVASVKKAATGRGIATKQEMVTRAKAQWKLTKKVGKNEADALWVAEAFRRFREVLRDDSTG